MSVALTSYPFDTQSVSEAQWGQMAQLWLGDGVLGGVLNELAVSGYSGGMNVHVESGRCWVQGYFGENPTQQTLAIAAAHATLNRIDRVVLRLDLVNNRILLDVVTGANAGSPSAPALTRTGTVWELSLAQVSVVAAATSIASGNVTDERNNQAFEGANTTGVCGYAYSASPHARCKSTTRPTKWPVGATIYEEDTGFVLINTNTYASPTWTRSGPAAFATPTIAFGPAFVQGSANTYIRSDATLKVFDDTVFPSTQAIADAAVKGTSAFAAHLDHKHAMPSFATSAITLSNAQGAGAAVTPLRSDAVIAAFDATVPSTSALGDAAAAGAVNFAARAGHVHGREANPHLYAYKATSTARVNNTLADDPDLKVTLPATSIWQFEFLLIVSSGSDTPSLKIVITTAAGVGTLDFFAESPTLFGGAATPYPTYNYNAGGFAVSYPITLYAALSYVPVRVSGIINHTGGTTTTFKLQWAQNVTNATATNIHEGSWLNAHRLA